MSSRSIFSLLALSAAATALLGCSGGSSDGATGPTVLGSHLYTQTNAAKNEIIHYARKADGTLIEIERVASGGKGTNGSKPLTGEESAPDSLTSAGAVAMTPEHDMLFSVNAGDSSVSSFKVGADGRLTLVDRQPTGETAAPSSLTYNGKTHTLYVLHTFGPNHIRSFKVIGGKLVPTGQAYTANTPEFNNRIPTQIISSPDGRFVLVDVLFNAPPRVVDGSPVLTPSNAATKDGLMVYPVKDDGSLGPVVVNDAGGPTPFSLAFLNGSTNTFVNTLAAASGAVLSTLDADGKVSSTPLASVDLSPAPNGPAETCWVSLSPDNHYAYATNFGLGNLTSFSIDSGQIRTVGNNLGHVPGDGKYKALAGISTSGPVDSWASRDGYLYQIYPNAQQLVAYRMNGEQLDQVGSYPVPYNSTMGLTGF